MASQRYLTKSRFKLALECSTKLFYTGKKDYPDKKLNDTFLAALAEGGYQVGELAKCYFPGGENISELDYVTSLEKTNELLKREHVIIYEAAFQFENLFIRADIVIKNGHQIDLYEVKAKSYDSVKDSLTNTKGIVAKWKPYVYDVAFQKYVIQHSRPDLKVNGHLMLADKCKTVSIDGLNQLFSIKTDDSHRTVVEYTGDVSPISLGNQILCKVNVDDICDGLFGDKPFTSDDPKTFQQWIHYYADSYEHDQLLQDKLLGRCSKCEFKSTIEQEVLGARNGYKECWKRAANFEQDDFARPHILDLWYFLKKDTFIENGKYFMSQLFREDLEAAKPKVHLESGLSRTDRQWMQIVKSAEEVPQVHFDFDSLQDVFAELVYPLHFIDFETTAVAIPFNKGQRPYEQVAFQFSHHVLFEDGRVEHQHEWLNDQQGHFPNFEFVRQLKAALQNDRGSILRYSNHENNILTKIYEQLRISNEPDAHDLCNWIQTITHSTSSSTSSWKGERDMVDLWDWVKKYYFAVECNGSNSIKAILPAVLNNSTFLKSKYSQPVYGDSIPSLNFKDQVWIKYDEHGKVINPYKQLEPVFTGIDEDMLDDLVLDESAEINDGGAAMMAYARMQFSTMSVAERQRIRNSLLRYCELDTLAMVMIVEDWRDRLSRHAG